MISGNDTPISILIVEDDPLFYHVAASMLKRTSHAFELHWCNTFDSALEAIDTVGFDICLLDYTLGEQTGLDLLNHLRSAGSLMPVIMLTGRRDKETDLAAMNAGADDYLIKGEFDVRMMERSIRYAIERRRSEAERRKAEVALRESRQLFQTFMDHTPALAFMKDSEQRYVFVNREVSKAFNTSIDALVGMTAHDLFPVEQARIIDEIDAEVLEKRELVERIECLTIDGEERFVLMFSFPIYDAQGNILIGAKGIDITRQKLAEQELQEAYDRLEIRVAERTAELQSALSRLEQAHQQQKQFVADASHDLRTPLTIIRGELELLLERPSLDTRTADAVRRALSGINRLDVLSNDLLLLARLDGKPERIIFKTVRLDELLLDSISDLSLVSRERDIAWQIDIPEAIEVECNRHTLDRAIRNVLENAIKYSPEGSSVNVMLIADDNGVRLTIADNGVGIPAEDLPKVFDRFYRSDRTRTTEGTGLGLAIVKSVVEAHNGYVTLTSGQDSGTTVIVSLPLKQLR